MELWRDTKGLEGICQVSNYGRVKSLERVVMKSNGKAQIVKERITNGYTYPNGYKFVRFGRDSKSFLVHRLVAEAWIENPQNLPCVDHINGDRSDNRVENLRWCTHKENSNFEVAKKRMIDAQKKRRIYQYTLDGKLITVYESINEAAKQNGFLLSNIWACASHYKDKRGCGLKTYKGYRWSYTPL